MEKKNQQAINKRCEHTLHNALNILQILHT